MTDNAKPAFAGTSEAPCSEILITPITVAVHRKDDNPVFGESVIHVSVADEAAGAFIVLQSNERYADGLRINPEELETVVVAARQLIAGLPNDLSEGSNEA